MGMTIDNCISKLTEILEEATEDENSVCYVTDVDEPTLKTAIDTMRKYQKIQEIVKEWGKSGLLQDKFYDLINEVIEDGKIS